MVFVNISFLLGLFFRNRLYTTWGNQFHHFRYRTGFWMGWTSISPNGGQAGNTLLSNPLVRFPFPPCFSIIVVLQIPFSDPERFSLEFCQTHLLIWFQPSPTTRSTSLSGLEAGRVCVGPARPTCIILPQLPAVSGASRGDPGGWRVSDEWQNLSRHCGAFQEMDAQTHT